MKLSNYLFFTTQCEEALAFYAACRLGTVTQLKRHGDHGGPVSARMAGRVLHAKFEGRGISFYASDNDDAEPMRGSAHILELDDPPATRALFQRLSDGGVVTTPLAVQPWRSLYGKFTDKFGVQWMLECPMR